MAHKIKEERPTYGNFGVVDDPHHPLTDAAGKIVRATARQIADGPKGLAAVRVAYTYAVRCVPEKLSKKAYAHCGNFVRQTLENELSQRTEEDAPLVVLAMGVEPVKALGIKAAKLADVQSRVLTNVPVGEGSVTVIPTVSAAMLNAAPGHYKIFERDFERALTLAVTKDVKINADLSILTKDYVIPQTLDEVQALVDRVLAYTGDPKTSADNWPISLDTETNTKFPHRENARMLAVSFAWDRGKAAAVALWHKDAPYDPEKAAEIVRRLVECPKPKVLHNAKFDWKVFHRYAWCLRNFVWDTMLGEHALEEDKKGQYGLKSLTRALNPAFAAYADELYEQQEKSEGGTQLDNVRKKKAEVELSSEDAELSSPKKKKAAVPKKKKGTEDGGFENIDLPVLLRYAAIDADMTWRLGNSQLSRFPKEEGLYRQRKAFARKTEKHRVIPEDGPGIPPRNALQSISIPAVPVMAEMEYRGIRVDQPYLQELDDALGQILVKTERELYEICGKRDLKLNSAAAIANMLFNEGYIDSETGKRVLHEPVTLTAKGQAQTTDKVLKALAAKAGCRFSAKKLVYAKAYKAKNTFVANVRDLSSLDGYMHTNYNQHGTATYRLSSNDENMQNIPKKLAGYSIKKLFIPDDDSYLFVNADAKGAEVRIFTAYSKDKELIKSLNDGFDTHCFIGAAIVQGVRKTPETAAEVLKGIGLDDQYPLVYEDFDNRERLKLVPSTAAYGEMLDKFRTAVKRVVFGILYGAAAPKIAETIGISIEQASQIIELLFTMFPSIPEYMQQTKWELREFKLVETYFGRRRRFSVEGAPRYMISRAERQAINFKIQSTSSDIVIGCLTSANEPLKRDLGGRMLLTVHDSLGFQIPKKYATQLPDFIETYLVKQTAQKYPWLPVEFRWDFEVGPSYGELQPLDAWLAKQDAGTAPAQVTEETDGDDREELDPDFEEAEPDGF